MRRAALLLALILVSAACADDVATTTASEGSVTTGASDTVVSDTSGDSGTTTVPATTQSPSTTRASGLSPEAEAALERLVDAWIALFGPDPTDVAVDIFFSDKPPSAVGGGDASDMPPDHKILAYSGVTLDLEMAPFTAPGYSDQVFGDTDLSPGEYLVGLFVTEAPISVSPSGQSQFVVSYRWLDPLAEVCDAPDEPYHRSSETVILDLTFGAGTVFGLQCSDGAFGAQDLDDVAFYTLPDIGDNLMGYAWRIPESGGTYAVNPGTFYRSPDNSFAVEDGRFHTLFDPEADDWGLQFIC